MLKQLCFYSSSLFSISTVCLADTAFSETTLDPIIVYDTYDFDTPFAVTGNSALWSPQSVDAIDATDMQAIGADRIEDVADTLPGVLLGRNQAGIGSNVYLRGFSLQGRLHLDGIPDNRRYFLRDPETIERVEVIKGLDSVLFGSGSPGGIVNYVSKKPSYKPVRTLSFGTGSPERYRLSADISDEIEDTDMAWRALLVGQKAATGREHVDDDRLTFMPSWLLQTDDHELLIQGEYARQNRDYDFDNVFINGTPVYDVSYTDPRTDSTRSHSRLSAQYLRHLNEQWRVHLNSSVIHGKRDEKLIGFWQMNPDERTLEGFYREIEDDYQQYAFRGELRKLTTTETRSHETRLGVDWFRIDSDIKSASEIGGFTLDAFEPVFDFDLPEDTDLTRSDRRTVDTEEALYLHHRSKFAEDFLFTAGLRYSDYSADSYPAGAASNTISNDKTTASIGAVWGFAPSWKLFANRNESFSPNAGRDVNGQAFVPKFGVQYELGLRYKALQSDTLVETSIYQIDQDNLLTRDPANTAYKIPLGAVRMRGFELTSTLPVTARLSLKPSLTLYDSEITKNSGTNEGNQLHSVPRKSAALLAHYSPNKSLELNMGIVYVGERMGNNANTFKLPSYTRIDAGASWKLNKKTKLNLGVRNLTDENYVATGGAVDFLVTGRDRTVTLDAEIQF